MPEQTPQGESDPGAASPDGKTVPIERLNAQIEKTRKLETAMAELQGKVEVLSTRPAPEAKPASTEPPEYTRAQLKAAVVQGSISEDDMENILDTQRDRRAAKIAGGTAATLVGNDRGTAVLSAEIGKYKAAMPDLGDQSSEGFRAVSAEFREMVAMGSPATLATELAALKAVFGPAAKLAKAGKREAESHEDTGSGSGEPGKAEVRDGKPKGLTAREKAYYEKLVGPGKMYPNWGAVTTMIEKRADPELRKRMGARYA